MPITIEQIYRYPVKGFRAERLAGAEMHPGAGLAHDRAFAFTSGNLPMPESNEGWSPSRTFLQMTVYPQLARFSARIDVPAGTLNIANEAGGTASAELNGSDDSAVNRLMNSCFEPGPVGDIHLHRICNPPGHWDYSDSTISIINLASVEWLEWVSALKLSPLRFRGNLYVSGLEPFAEFSLVGRTVRIGDLRLKVLRPIMRCAMTSADPWTGDTSISVTGILQQQLGHLFCGVYAKVLSGGHVAEADTMDVEDGETFDPLGDLPVNVPKPELWPRTATASHAGGRLILQPQNPDWHFLPANAGARVRLHTGLGFQGKPTRTHLIEDSKGDALVLAGEAAGDIEQGATVIVSGPVSPGGGRA